ncbi:MAG TPA: glycoside hydrolase family 27 protein [Bacteroidales bacterium]|nr:glycoside hydrolase family 27 protein [Bacteroidales bacterium]
MKKSFTFILLSLMAIPVLFAQRPFGKDGLPPMGWNSWNWFGKYGIDEQIVREVIDAVADGGLKDAGYEYIVVDGGWRDTVLDRDGKLRANPDRFPHGMKALADYAHANGLKFGLHTVPGTHDCGGDKVGGFGHEELQIQQFADWGIDFIKLDKCKYEDGYSWNEALLKDTYFKWYDLLQNCGRPIVLSISAYTFRDWYPEICVMARTTGDILARVNGKDAVFDNQPRSVMYIAEENNESAPWAGNGYWNDPDMLVTGDQGLTPDEQKAHFALWCIMSAPLMLGNDPRNMSREENEIITNKDAIAVDQDPTEQGTRIRVSGKTEIWAKNLENGHRAVLLLNRDTIRTMTIELTAEDIGLKGDFSVRDIYAKEDLGLFTGSFSSRVNPSSGLFILVGKD